MPHRPLSHDDVQAVLRSVQRVLHDRQIHQPVQVRFAAAASGLCWEWRCEPRGAAATQSCEWVAVPCR
jgi:hypothetical protein